MCRECQELRNYVRLRLDRCHFGADKPTCAKCSVHCYQRERREQIKVVMRYAGPRMIWEHPWLSPLASARWLAAASVTHDCGMQGLTTQNQSPRRAKNQTPAITPMQISDIQSQFETAQETAIITRPPMSGVISLCFLP